MLPPTAGSPDKTTQQATAGHSGLRRVADDAGSISGYIVGLLQVEETGRIAVVLIVAEISRVSLDL